ncbi:MAG: site-specific integrase [Kiritimatiellae bacterium]|nr:site-specific integrase [Kiritimatiellia bacterium]
MVDSTSNDTAKAKARRKYSVTYRHGRIRLCKRRATGIWYAKFKLPTGEYRERSLGTTSKKDALRDAEHLSATLLNGKYGVADGSIALKALIGRFLAAKRGRVKVKTLERLQTTINAFTKWLGARRPAVAVARQVTPDTIRAFQAYRSGRGVHPRSVNNDIQNLHTLFLWAVREKLISRSPADYSRNGSVDRYKVPRTEPDVYTDGEVKKLIEEAERRGDMLARDLVATFAATGLRFEEAAHLTPANLFWLNPFPIIEVRAQNGWTPKDPLEVKRIPMLPEIQDLMRRRDAACTKRDEYIFKNSTGGKVHVNRSRERLRRLFPGAGINGDRTLHWHSFRNYFIIRALKKGVAVPAIMAWTGHDSAGMVLHYARAISEQDLHDEFRKML